MKLELGKFYDVKEINETMIKIDSFGNSFVYKDKDFLLNGKDDGDRYLLQPILNHSYRVSFKYNIKDIENKRV